MRKAESCYHRAMLTSKQRAHLMSLSNPLSPVVMLGKAGKTDQVVKALDLELGRHELLKLKFQDFKDEKRDIANELALATKSELVRIVGNIAIFFRQAEDPEKRSISLPKE